VFQELLLAADLYRSIVHPATQLKGNPFPGSSDLFEPHEACGLSPLLLPPHGEAAAATMAEFYEPTDHGYLGKSSGEIALGGFH